MSLNQSDARSNDETRATQLPGESSSDQIKRIATQLFFDKGFNATSTRNITDACGLTPGALYNHFRSKDDLLFIVITEAHDKLDRFIYKALGQPANGPAEKLANILREMVFYHIRHPHEALVANQEYAHLSAERVEQIRRIRRRVRSVVEDILRSGVAVGEFTIPAGVNGPAYNLTAIGMLNTLIRVSEWFDKSGPLDPPQLARIYVELGLRMVGADPSSIS